MPSNKAYVGGIGSLELQRMANTVSLNKIRSSNWKSFLLSWRRSFDVLSVQL